MNALRFSLEPEILISPCGERITPGTSGSASLTVVGFDGRFLIWLACNSVATEAVCSGVAAVDALALTSTLSLKAIFGTSVNLTSTAVSPVSVTSCCVRVSKPSFEMVISYLPEGKFSATASPFSLVTIVLISAPCLIRTVTPETGLLASSCVMTRIALACCAKAVNENRSSVTAAPRLNLKLRVPNNFKSRLLLILEPSFFTALAVFMIKGTATNYTKNRPVSTLPKSATARRPLVPPSTPQNKRPAGRRALRRLRTA
ncbi:MAG: hypothetical protein JMDDDDMK_00890 [Acidobacteria bacterium]|nr:hypothetical protein [Acidobacteriota bacterium]